MTKRSNWVPPTEPTASPCDVYPDVPNINCANFQLGQGGISEEQYAAANNELKEYEVGQKANFLGYQANQALSYEHLKPYLDIHINNIGDAFTSGNFTVNSKFSERAVLDYFASLWRAQWPNLPKTDKHGEPVPEKERRESYWGYVVSMGGSEGNLYGLWNARDYLAGKYLYDEPHPPEEVGRNVSKKGWKVPLRRMPKAVQGRFANGNPNASTPVCFYSQDSHYSIIKMMTVLQIPTYLDIATSTGMACPLNFPEDYPPGFPSAEDYPDMYVAGWPKLVPSDEDGRVYIPALVKMVDSIAALGYPIMVNFNYGTTFKGAYDQVEKAIEQLYPVYEKYGLLKRVVHYDPNDPSKTDVRMGYWHHVDGALGAAYMPFLEMAAKEGVIEFPEGYEFPIFDFRIPYVHSIAVSGHKWTGAPWPCGIFMTKVKYQLLPPENPEYIGAPDTTFAGSRNGFSAMILWDYLARHDFKAQMEKAIRLETLAIYARDQLLALQEELGQDLWVKRSPLSLTVRFKAAPDDIVFKYSLSGETLYEDGELRSYSHIYMMEHVTTERIDRLIDDLRAYGYPPSNQLKKKSDIRIHHSW